MRAVFFSAAVLASQISIAATPIDGWYSTLFGGYAYLPNNVTLTSGGNTWSQPTYHFGYDVGGSIGFKSNPMRYEGELTYVKANVDGFKVNNISQTGIDGYSDAFLAMANVYYDFPAFLPCIQPYLGVGVGYGIVEAMLKGQGPYAQTRFSGRNGVFAYQPIAGFAYNYSENFAITASYRYVATNRVDDLGKIFQSHLANVGLVFRFNSGTYK